MPYWTKAIEPDTPFTLMGYESQPADKGSVRAYLDVVLDEGRILKVCVLGELAKQFARHHAADELVFPLRVRFSAMEKRGKGRAPWGAWMVDEADTAADTAAPIDIQAKMRELAAEKSSTGAMVA